MPPTEKSLWYRQIEEFMQKARQETPVHVKMPDQDTRLLRARLILEEALETIYGLGFELAESYATPELVPHEGRPDLVEIADGCADVMVVTLGTLIACGIPDETLMQLVNTNNLAKFGPGHQIREDGKLVKPPGHKPPAIAEYLGTLSHAELTAVESEDDAQTPQE